MDEVKLMLAIGKNVKPILALMTSHSGKYIPYAEPRIVKVKLHGKDRFIVVEETGFESNNDASIYKKIIARINSHMNTVIKPPMIIFLGLFAYLKIIMEVFEKHGNIKQQTATPEIVTKNNKIVVVEKTAFESEADAKIFLDIRSKMNSVKI